ncbi:MAG: toxin-antitoxin system YwqK family antitoxin [Candidatus Goldiibacteriota bacterium]
MNEYTTKIQENVQKFYEGNSEVATWYYNPDGTIKKEGKSISGVVRQYYDNDVLASEMSYAAGELNGYYILFDEKGTAEEEGAFKANELHGVYKQYYPDGRLKLQGKYKHGKKDGVFRLYFENGVVEEEENYKNGVLHGEYRSHFKNGAIETYAKYKKGVLKHIKQYDVSGAVNKEKKY